MPSRRSVRGKLLLALFVGGALTIADVQANIPPPDPPKPVTNSRPTPPSVTVNAGSDQTVNGGSTVTLSGTSSASGATWSQTAGRKVTLSGASSASPTFRAPSATSSQQTLTFRYSASRSWSWCRRETRQYNPLTGITTTTCVDTTTETLTDSDTVNIKVRARVLPLSARAGSDQTVASGASVTLSGSATGGSGTKSYAWTQTGGSPTVTIGNANRASASFRAPTVATRTTLTFRLTVKAGGRTSTDTVSVTVTARDTTPTDPVPTSVLGAPKVVDVIFASRPAAGSTYRLGERIRLRVAFDGIVSVSGRPTLALGIGSRTRSMTHVGLGRGRVLDFEYQVQASDLDTNGVSIGADALSVPTGDSIANPAGEAATLSLSGHAITNDPSRKVDGSQGSGLPVGGTLPACTANDP